MDRWKKIQLELARTSAFPNGSVSRGYLLELPLDAHGRVDRTALALRPHRATVRRYWSTEPDEVGLVVATGEAWAMRCTGSPDRTLVLRRPLEAGEQLFVVDPDGAALPFTIASIR